MKLKTIKRLFSAAFWPSLLIGAVATVTPLQAVTPLAYLQSQTAPTYRSGHTMLRLARCGWPYLRDSSNRQLDIDTQKQLASRWGFVFQLGGWAGSLSAYNSFSDVNSIDRYMIDFAKNNPGYEPHVWECRWLPSFSQSPSCYLRRANGTAILGGDGNPIWSPAAPDSELLTISQKRLDALNIGRQYGPITYIGNLGESGLGVVGDGHTNTQYWEQDPTVMAAKGTLDWWSYISQAKAHQEIVMHSKVAAGIPELKHYYWYANGGSYERNRWWGWQGWMWGYEWMRNITPLASEETYYHYYNDGYTGSGNQMMKRLNAKGWEIRLGHPYAYDWVWGPRDGNGTNDEARRWIGYLKVLHTMGTIGVNTGDYDQTSPLQHPDVNPASPPMWMRQIVDTSRVQGFFSWIEPFVRRSDLLTGPNSHAYSTENPAYEFPVSGDPTARVVARKMNGANRWLITAWAAGGADRNVTVTIPTLGTITVSARDVGSVYYANGSLTQLDSSDGTLVTLDTGTLTAKFGDLYSATATSNAADDATFVAQTVPSVMVAGQQYAVSVTMKNNGTATWTSAGATPYNLGVDNTTWGFGRVKLPGAVSRGGLVTFNFTVTAPTTPGIYNFQWQMVHDGVTWFGGQSLNCAVTVSGSAMLGKIEAESYSNMNGVLTTTTADTGGGLIVGWVDTGDWMDYLVNVQIAGTYNVDFRVASPYFGTRFQLKKDSTVLATISVPNTGGWQAFQTVTATGVPLSAGWQTLRIHASTGGWNMNWMNFTTIPGKIEAESYSTMNGVMIQSTTDTGGGLKVGYTDTGDWMDYTVNVKNAGTYNVDFRLGCRDGGKQLQLKSGSTVLATVNVPSTGDWDTLQTVTATGVSLAAGPQTLRIYASTGGWNLNWVNFTFVSASAPAPAPAVAINGDFVLNGQSVYAGTGALVTAPNWNTMATNRSGATVSGLLDSNGGATGVSFTYGAALDYNIGYNHLLIRDYMYTSGGTSTWSFSHLAASTQYDLYLYGASVVDGSGAGTTFTITDGVTLTPTKSTTPITSAPAEWAGNGYSTMPTSLEGKAYVQFHITSSATGTIGGAYASNGGLYSQFNGFQISKAP